MTSQTPAPVDLEKLTALVETLNGADKLETMLSLLTTGLPGLLAADRCSVTLVSDDEKELTIYAPTGILEGITTETGERSDRTQVWRAIRSGELVVFEAQADGPGVEAQLHRAGLRSTALVPLILGSQRLGTINVSSLAPGRFRGAEQKTLHHVAYIVAGSIIQRRMLAAARKAAAVERERAMQLSVLNELATNLTACVRVDDVYRLVLGAVRQVMPKVRRAGFVRFNDELTEFAVVALFDGLISPFTETKPVAGTWLSEVIATGVPMCHSDFADGVHPELQFLAADGLTNGWSVPISQDHHVHGVLCLASTARLDGDVQSIGMISTIGQLMSVTMGRLLAQQHAEKALQTFIDDSPVFIMAVNEDGIVEKVSHYGAKTLGFDAAELLGQPFSCLHPHGYRVDAGLRLRVWARQGEDAMRSFEVMMLRGNGDYQWTRQSGRTVSGVHGKLLTLIACEDIAAVRKLTDELNHQVRHDSLTGLSNRVHFEERLQQVASAAATNGERYAVLFMDIDRFKAVNDSHGHAVGDNLLCEVARRIKSVVRSNDLVARIGGDEFQIVLRDLRELADAFKVADNLRLQLSQPLQLTHQELSIGVSIGVALSDGVNTGPAELIKRADTALYRAKELGRNNVQVFTESLTSRMSRRSLMEQELVRAIHNNELRLQLQPRFRTNDGAMVAVEALVRWQHPEHGLLGPNRFIPLAEESMLVGQITSWVLSQGIRQLGRLHEQWPHLRLGVNVSARELMVNGDLVPRVMGELQAQRMDPASLELEITETALFEDLDAGREVLTRLTDVGIQIALDDFGTGYASLSQLVALPIDTVKIDGSFVSALESDARARSITDTVAQLTANLGIHCVAEGVETPWQAAYLQKIPVDALQGYLLARPLWLDDLLRDGAALEVNSRRLLTGSDRPAAETGAASQGAATPSTQLTDR